MVTLKLAPSSRHGYPGKGPLAPSSPMGVACSHGDCSALKVWESLDPADCCRVPRRHRWAVPSQVRCQQVFVFPSPSLCVVLGKCVPATKAAPHQLSTLAAYAAHLPMQAAAALKGRVWSQPAADCAIPTPCEAATNEAPGPLSKDHLDALHADRLVRSPRQQRSTVWCPPCACLVQLVRPSATVGGHSRIKAVSCVFSFQISSWKELETQQGFATAR